MRVYTYSEARQRLAALLEEARREGAIRFMFRNPVDPAGNGQPQELLGREGR